MRLFVAINFDEETRNKLLDIQQRLKACGNGNFTRPENLHLTVVFLGEAKSFSSVIKSIETHFCAPLELCFNKVGKFRNSLYWVGIRQNKKLKELYYNICNDLVSKGYNIDCNKDFRPHITLVRELVCEMQPDLSLEEFSMTASNISLMKSERINGRLTYTEIYKKEL